LVNTHTHTQKAKKYTVSRNNNNNKTANLLPKENEELEILTNRRKKI